MSVPAEQANVMKHLFSSRRIGPRGPSWPVLLASTVVLVSTSAMAEYKLHSGDTLEISIAGIPDLRQRSAIGVDGQITLPLVGQIQVSGLSVAEARAKIGGGLANRQYRQSTADGREIPRLILADEIVVTIVEYRPIYVSGDVVKPGEYMFRPGMTVRQAIALAGGYGRTPLRAADPFLQSADLRSEYASLWAEYATEQARIWRLRTELGEQGVKYTADKAPIPAEVSKRLTEAAAEQLKARMADRDSDKAILQKAISNADLQLSILAEKKKKDVEGNQADTADFEKVRELFQKGITSNTRLSEARRAALFSSNQLLQTIVEISNTQRQQGEYYRQLEKVDNQYRMDAWRELQDANTRLAQVTARLKGVGDKLVYTGQLPAQSQLWGGGQIDIAVHRDDGNGPQRLAVNEGFELAPGDVVDAALQAEGGAVASPSSSNSVR
jgi:polysaccharide export outer membrane protein